MGTANWAQAKWTADEVVGRLAPRPNHMRMFTAEPYSKSSIALRFLEPADSKYPDGTLLCAIEGVMIRMSTSGYPTSPTDGTLVVDNKVLGKYEKTNYLVNGLVENRKYYFSAFPYSSNKVYNTSVNDANRTTTAPSGVKVYGIKRDITVSSPVWTRTNDAIGKIATASVGTVAGSSDFDSCMPWSGIARETISTGDVMVKIPKFWYRRYREGNVEYIQIADGAKDGFAVHPAFRHGGVEKDYLYVGAYKTSNSKFSKSGASPQVDQTRSSMRSAAKSKGSGWGLIDVSAMSAIQMLMMVEFATNDSQTAIGAGYTSNGNSSSRSTGSCDSVPNLTGAPSGSSGYVDVVYRGIEGLWGNVYEWVDGINYNSSERKYYICNDPTKYADDTKTNYTALSYTGLTSSGYISKMGLDSTGENSYVMYPTEISGSSSTYYCDQGYYSTSYTWYVLCSGGYWSYGSSAGVFYSGFACSSSGADSYFGSRLLYIPS